MLRALRDFRIGWPQIIAGLLLLAFLSECLWASSSRHLSGLERDYSAFASTGLETEPFRGASAFTSVVAALTYRSIWALRHLLPGPMPDGLAILNPWILRLPFVFFGLSLGGAVWWVARRLFNDVGGYVALALFCFSPAMVKISSSIGPEIILAWSLFGLIYTAIGVAHTVYAPPRKWIPRILLLGVAIGISVSTTLWAFTVVLLAFAFIVYLTPGRRKAALAIFLSAAGVGLLTVILVTWMAGSTAPLSRYMMIPDPTREFLSNLAFVIADGDRSHPDYVLPSLLAIALVAYGSWRRARYFGNTAPLIASFATVLLFALMPWIPLWKASLGLSFLFLFIGGIAADVLEMPVRRVVIPLLFAILALKGVLGLSLLRDWIHQNQI